jgi:CBS domain-containing protein
MKVKDFMVPREGLCILPPETTIDRVASSLLSRNIGCVVIEDQSKEFQGLITKTDVIDCYLSGNKAEEAEASEWASRTIQWCNEDDTREKVCTLMIELNVHHLAVRNKKLELIGMVSSLDVTRDIALDAEDTFPYLRSLFKIPGKRQDFWKSRSLEYGKIKETEEKESESKEPETTPEPEKLAEPSVATSSPKLGEVKPEEK